MADGTGILYSTVVRSRTVHGNPESKAGLQIMPLWPVDGIAYNVGLWQVPAAGGQSVQLFNQEGRGIGIIAPARDASAVLVSFITSSASFVERINTATNAANLASNAPMVSLQIVPLNTPGPRREYAFGSGPGFAPVDRSRSRPPFARRSPAAGRVLHVVCRILLSGDRR
jgi:hypothetical protein